MTRKTNSPILLIFLLLFLFCLSCNSISDLLFDHEPPTADVYYPENSIVVERDSGNITIKVRATDNRYVSSVHFYVDSAYVMEQYSPNYSDSISCYEYDFNPANYADCLPHAIYAIAYDEAGNYAITLPVNITVLDNYYAKTDSLIYNITTSTATAKGDVSCNDNHLILSKGVCWAQYENPTIMDAHTTDGYGLGSFTSQLIDLVPATQYYVRAYATYDIGTLYGDNIIFRTLSENIPEYEMINIEGNSFTMGDLWGDGYTRELPTHTVTVDDYMIGTYEVTQDIYLATMGLNPSGTLGDRKPVHDVTWKEAIEFCNAYSSAKGLEPVYSISSTAVTCDFNNNGYRLPTEAEWEFAARSAGREDRKWSGTSRSDSLQYYANILIFSQSIEEFPDVGQKLSNDLGIYDMTGNVYEWCWSSMPDYTETPEDNPRETNIDLSSEHVMRGGSINRLEKYCRNAWRFSLSPGEEPQILVGLRLVKNAE